jgi:hypothetical protein
VDGRGEVCELRDLLRREIELHGDSRQETELRSYDGGGDEVR